MLGLCCAALHPACLEHQQAQQQGGFTGAMNWPECISTMDKEKSWTWIPSQKMGKGREIPNCPSIRYTGGSPSTFLWFK